MKMVLFIAFLLDDLESYYRDEEFYEQVYWWCAILVVVVMLLARFIFSNLDK